MVIEALSIALKRNPLSTNFSTKDLELLIIHATLRNLCNLWIVI
jgi:hypothetical protein